MLANGEKKLFDTYAATIIWDGAERKILVEAADAPPLVGMALLDGYDVHMQVTDRGPVRIEALKKSEGEETP